MIALLLPTRNKPEELQRVINETDGSQSCIYFYVAKDDPKLEQYKQLSLKNETNDRVLGYIGGEQIGFSHAINFLASQVKADTKLLMRCEDDFYFQDKNWADKYLAQIPKDEMAMIWCNYVLKPKSAEPHTAAITMKWYKTLHYFSLPDITHYFCDNVLKDLAEAINRDIYIEEPLINHKHNAFDPRKSDPIAVEKRALWNKDVHIYKAWREGIGYKQDVEKLQQQLA